MHHISDLRPQALLDGTIAFKSAALGWPTNKGGGMVRGGAGGGDAFTVMQMERRKQNSTGRDCRKTGEGCPGGGEA